MSSRWNPPAEWKGGMSAKENLGDHKKIHRELTNLSHEVKLIKEHEMPHWGEKK